VTLNRASGIDVSHWKPILDFRALRSSNILFVGAKTSEGHAYIDPTFETHRKGIRRNGFSLAIYYHFARSGNPIAQAERFAKIVGKLEENERVCLDLEVVPVLDDVISLPENPHTSIDWITRFYDVLFERYPDRRPLIYTSKRIWRMLAPEGLASEGSEGDSWKYAPRVDLWAPRYNDHGIEPNLPAPWAKSGWTIWQWSDGDFPPKITLGVGRCDVNWFRSDKLALENYAKERGID
jgi:GH25 family lysozyme M1 (1,4-beta-N-acetylmuramidase)